MKFNPPLHHPTVVQAANTAAKDFGARRATEIEFWHALHVPVLVTDRSYGRCHVLVNPDLLFAPSGETGPFAIPYI